MISWVQFQFRTLDLCRSWRGLYSIVFTMRLNCFWMWESVSLRLAESWCQIIIEIEMTDDPGADAEGQCCVLIRGAKWKLTALMSAVLPQGRLAVTSFPFQPRAGSHSCPCFVPFPDGWQTAGSVKVGVEASFCLGVLPKANWHYKRAEYQRFVTAEWPFSRPGTKCLCFSKHRHSP